MSAANTRVAVPARLSDTDGADARVAGAQRIFDDVVTLVRAAGLDPVVVSDPVTDLSGFAAVVLPGGGDVNPARYAGEAIEQLYDVNEAQDELDFVLAERAIELGLPVLGICRGAQVLNVVYGGSLHEDLAPSAVAHRSTEASAEDLFVWHPVSVVPGTILARSLGQESVSIASAHHQGVDRLGEGLVASALAADGLVEAFEDPARWVVGVQWHPEADGTDPVVRDGQFRALAAEVARRGQLA